MGTEIAPFIEWRFYEELEWHLLEQDSHAKHQQYTRELNHFYLQQPSLWQQSYVPEGHKWHDADNSGQSILLFRRQGIKPDDFTIILLNFQPDVYHNYKIGVPLAGSYREIFNSDRKRYGGSGQENQQMLQAKTGSCHGQNYYIEITVPPIGGVVFAPYTEKKATDKN